MSDRGERGGAREGAAADGQDARVPAAPGAHELAARRFVNYSGLTGHGRAGLRRDALAIAAAALAAVDPAVGLRGMVTLEGDELVVTPPRERPIVTAPGDDAVPGDDPIVTPPGDDAAQRRFDLRGRRVFVAGAGKASIGMAAVLDELLGGRIAEGAVVVKRGQAVPLRHIQVLEASHPVPDEGSLAGGLRLLEVAAAARPGDLLIGLVTGGSSALAVAPADGLTLADKVAANRLLLACGADIVSINQVRKHLSHLKGGRLARAAGCEIVNFTVSDVVGDPLDAVTDLTVPDSSTFADAQAVCDRWGLWAHLPRRVAEHLRRGDPAEESCHELDRVATFVVADARRMCAAAAAAAEALGYRAEVLRLDLEGESAAAGRWFARRVAASGAGRGAPVAAAGRDGAAAGSGAALVAGGEATTVLAHGQGLSGGGGPSQEGALAGALELAGGPASCLLCLDSDGHDGPGHAAGGLVDDLTAAALAAARADAQSALAAHASGTALEAVGDRAFTGPTGTNVNDLKVGLVARSSRGA